MATASVSVVPKGLHHLEHIHANKFINKTASRIPNRGPQQFVQPHDRIRRWNIRPGDKVRLLVGKPADKYLNEENAQGGWKVHTVKTVDLQRNAVYLSGVSVKKSAVREPPPPEFKEWDTTKQREWTVGHVVPPVNRPVHYSNVQLCVDDAGENSTFASRITTSAPWFDTATRTLKWERYASKLSAPSAQSPDPRRGLIRIPWPDREPPAKFEKMPQYHTAEVPVTLQVPSTEQLAGSSALDVAAQSSHRLPRSSADRQDYYSAADVYVDNPTQRNEVPLLDLSMPLYLREELSPRFSRAKRQQGWNERRVTAELEREAAGREAVHAWESGGRDQGLKELLASEDVGLEGVRLRGRTRKEVREAALAVWDEATEAKKREVARAMAAGQSWDYETGQWVEGEKGRKLARKQAQKSKREEKLRKKMENLKLVERRNMVVPDAVRLDPAIPAISP